MNEVGDPSMPHITYKAINKNGTGRWSIEARGKGAILYPYFVWFLARNNDLSSQYVKMHIVAGWKMIAT